MILFGVASSPPRGVMSVLCVQLRLPSHGLSISVKGSISGRWVCDG